MKDEPNIQALWGRLLVDRLVELGVRRWVVSPGSRSSPLTRAAALNDDADVRIRIDERGAAFHALGIARGSGQPAAVITTSGTAVANLLPAVVEASMDFVPLIVITADRPPELLNCGANQAIAQPGIFGAYPRWAIDMPLPDDALPADTVTHAATRAYHSALGTQAGLTAGPVHINCPFREPLAPTPAAWDPQCLETKSAAACMADPIESSVTLSPKRWGDKGLLIVGAIPLADRERTVRAAAALAAALGWPWTADIRSGARLGNASPNYIAHMDRLIDAYAPRTVIQLGHRLTSKRLQQFLDAHEDKTYVLVDAHSAALDPGHTVTQPVVADPAQWCAAVTEDLNAESSRPATDLTALRERSARVDAILENALDHGIGLSEPYVARWLSKNVRAGHGLFLSSSMPIRDVQNYAAWDGPNLPVDANRGASGIDGVVSTAAGFAEGLGAPTTLLIGDLALLHDINALGCLQYVEQPLTIVVLNNGGGSIFSFLPIAEHDIFSPYFDTPHELQFEGAAAMFGMRYFRVRDRGGFKDAYRIAVALPDCALIEVTSGLADNVTQHEALEQAIGGALKA